MNRERGRRPGRRATPQQLAALTCPSASELLGQIHHWLAALEKFRNLWKDAPRIRFSKTGCAGGGGNHNWHVRLIPKPPHRTLRIAVTAPLAQYSPVDLMREVVLPLRQAGFEVSDPTPQRCGCATFTATPRRLAAE